jgi:hypothetical protein
MQDIIRISYMRTAVTNEYGIKEEIKKSLN